MLIQNSHIKIWLNFTIHPLIYTIRHVYYAKIMGGGKIMPTFPVRFDYNHFIKKPLRYRNITLKST